VWCIEGFCLVIVFIIWLVVRCVLLVLSIVRMVCFGLVMWLFWVRSSVVVCLMVVWVVFFGIY